MTGKTMQPVTVGGAQVYIDLDCGEAVTWTAAEEEQYGPIEKQGCDRCESGEARWVKAWAEQ